VTGGGGQVSATVVFWKGRQVCGTDGRMYGGDECPDSGCREAWRGAATRPTSLIRTSGVKPLTGRARAAPAAPHSRKYTAPCSRRRRVHVPASHRADRMKNRSRSGMVYCGAGPPPAAQAGRQWPAGWLPQVAV